MLTDTGGRVMPTDRKSVLAGTEYHGTDADHGGAFLDSNMIII